MRKVTITFAALGLAALTGGVSAAGCGSKAAGMGIAGMQPAVMTGYGEPTLIRTGGYGASYAAKPAAVAKPDIVDTAMAAGNFTTLVKAAQAAGLVDTLKGDGPFTVFAPTDAAFAKLPEGTLEALLADKEKLASILKYHVVAGRLDASQVVGKERLTTVQGSELPVDSIRIASTDIMTSNGIIHVIDEVLVPQS